MTGSAAALFLCAYVVLFCAGAVLERLGVPAELLSRLLTVAVLCGVALPLIARATASAESFRTGGRPFRPLAAGAWTSLHAAGAVALVALGAFLAGDSIAAPVLASALPAGLLLAGALILPAIGRSGATSLPVFLEHRASFRTHKGRSNSSIEHRNDPKTAYTFRSDALARPNGAPAARFAAALVAAAVCLLLAAGLMQVGAWCVAALLGLSGTHAILLAAGFVLLAAIPGGMKAQAGVTPLLLLIVGTSVAALAIWSQGSGGLLPEWSPAAISWPALRDPGAMLGLLLPALGAAAGIAALPTLLVPALAEGKREKNEPRRAGRALAWSLALSLPLSAALAAAALSLSADAGWNLPSPAPFLPGAPLAVSALAGATVATVALTLAAALATVACGTLSHDLYGMLNMGASEGRRLFVSRLLLLLAVPALARAAFSGAVDTYAAASFALALAAAGLFPALALAALWKFFNGWGAFAAIAAGTGLCLYLLAGRLYDLPVPAFVQANADRAAMLAHLHAAALAAGGGLVTAIAVSLIAGRIRRPADKLPEAA